LCGKRKKKTYQDTIVINMMHKNFTGLVDDAIELTPKKKDLHTVHEETKKTALQSSLGRICNSSKISHVTARVHILTV